MNEAEIFKIERPATSLLKLYLLRALLSGPGIFILLPLLFFRYHTLRYSLDSEGISMRWGILFRREINLTYARIQDIHLSSGLLQRWMGLADIKIQTASGSAGAEMTIEGLHEFEAVRDFLYARMRGHQDHEGGEASESSSDEVIDLLRGISDDLRRTRQALEGRGPTSEADHV